MEHVTPQKTQEELELELIELQKQKLQKEADQFKGIEILIHYSYKRRAEFTYDFFSLLRNISKEYEIQINFAKELRTFSLKRSLFEDLRRATKLSKHKNRLLRNFCVIFKHNFHPKIQKDLRFGFKNMNKFKGRPFSRLRSRVVRERHQKKEMSKSPQTQSSIILRTTKERKKKKGSLFKSKSGLKAKENLLEEEVTPQKDNSSDLRSKRDRAKAYDLQNRKRWEARSGKSTKNGSRLESHKESQKESETENNEDKIISDTEKSSPLQNQKIKARMERSSRDNSLRGSRDFRKTAEIPKRKIDSDGEYQIYNVRTPPGVRNRGRITKMSPSSGAPTDKTEHASPRREEEQESISTDIRKKKKFF